MNRAFFYILLIIFLISAQTVFAQSILGLPFGGKIVSQQVCTTPPGQLLFVKTSIAMTSIFWPAGNLKYQSFIVPHVGQNVLGMAARTPITCIFGFIPVGAGFPILYHGSSW